MTNFRKERVAENIRRVISEKIVRENSFGSGAMITINKVVVSPDMAVARVYYSAFGTFSDPEKLAFALKNQQREFRHAVSQKLTLKKAPMIQFHFDKNTEYASRIEGLLQRDKEPKI